MATNCGNQINCGCQDSFLTTPPAVPTPGACPEAQPCSEVFDAQCVKYTGDDILCLQNTLVSTNDSVADALVNIVEYFCESDSYISDVELQGTNLVFTGVNLAFDGTINLSGIGAGVTANNGLTMSTPTNVQLGGTLIQATTINVQNNQFLFTGIRNLTDTILKITNTGTGGGLYAETTGNGAVSGFCNGTAQGGVFTSATGFGVQGLSLSYTNPAGDFRNNSNLSNSTTDVLNIVSSPSGATLPAAGIGSAIRYELPRINGLGFKELTPSNKIISKFTDVADATLDSELIFQGRTGGANLQNLVTFKGDGEVRFHEYGVGNFVSAPAYMLGVDASGNVVEVAL